MARGTHETIGDFQYRVLRMIERLGDRASGPQIVGRLGMETKTTVNSGQFYTTANRLEDGGYVNTKKGVSNGNGRKVLFYSLTKQGAKAVKVKREMYKELSRI